MMNQRDTNNFSLSRRVKIMVVDDSAAIRAIIKKTLRDCPDIEICGTASDGSQAVHNVAIFDPDVVILDIEMPVMDGLTALPLILEKKKGVKVLICSTLSDRGAEVSIKALSLGAADCILKPSGADAIKGDNSFNQSLIRMVLSLGAANIARNLDTAPQVAASTGYVQLHAPMSQRPGILAIGCSTGGPNALLKILSGLKNLDVPIVITQHMPPKFTKILAEQIQKTAGLSCVEGMDGMALKSGCAYIAPGGYHMVFARDGTDTVIRLNQEEPENFCRPSVDPMLRSLISIYGSRIYAAILTGMGNDGLAGCQQVVQAGGHVIAQDEATSVVWGMPKAVVQAGICRAVLPDEKIADHIVNVFKN